MLNFWGFANKVKLLLEKGSNSNTSALGLSCRVGNHLKVSVFENKTQNSTIFLAGALSKKICNLSFGLTDPLQRNLRWEHTI